jgi:hypothetical protein
MEPKNAVIRSAVQSPIAKAHQVCERQFTWILANHRSHDHDCRSAHLACSQSCCRRCEQDNGRACIFCNADALRSVRQPRATCTAGVGIRHKSVVLHPRPLDTPITQSLSRPGLILHRLLGKARVHSMHPHAPGGSQRWEIPYSLPTAQASPSGFPPASIRPTTSSVFRSITAT